MTATLAITGVTGTVGGLVARELAADGLPLVLLARSRAKAPELPGAVVRLADYADRKLCEESLERVETLFMVSGRENENRLSEHFAFVDAAAAAGVRHIVYTSFMGAATDSTFTLAGSTSTPRSGSRPRAWRGRSCATASTRTTSSTSAGRRA